MPNLNDVCLQILDENEELTTVAVVDVESALLLGLAYTSDDLSLDYYETFAAALVNIFIGKNTHTVESMISTMRGEPIIPMIEQLYLVMNQHDVYVSTLRGSPHCLFFVLTNKSADIDEIWDVVRLNMAQVEAVYY